MINLSKGSKINLQKEKPGIERIAVGLGWDVNEGSSQYPFDLDASVFITNAEGKLIEDEYFVFYNNKMSPDGAVVHTGDNRTGAGEGDDETINIDLSKLNPAAAQIVFAITIDDAKKRAQDFGMVPNAFAHIYNRDTNELFVEYNLSGNFAGADAVLIGRFWKGPAGWEFEALDNAYTDGLAGLVEFYQ
jgi:tellurium resistance protein TerD